MTIQHYFEILIYLLIPVFIYQLTFEKKQIRLFFLISFLYWTIIEHSFLSLTRLYEYKNYLIWFSGLPIYIPLAWMYLFFYGYQIYKNNSHYFSKKGKIYTATFISLFILTYDFLIDLFAVKIWLWEWIGLNPEEQFFWIYYYNYLWWFFSVFILFFFYLKNHNDLKKVFINSIITYFLALCGSFYLLDVKSETLNSIYIQNLFLFLIFLFKTYTYVRLITFKNNYTLSFMLSTLLINLSLVYFTYEFVNHNFVIFFAIYSLILYVILFIVSIKVYIEKRKNNELQEVIV